MVRQNGDQIHNKNGGKTEPDQNGGKAGQDQNGGKIEPDDNGGKTLGNNDILAERVARLCCDQYGRLSKQGKPRAGQWTVLAGVVLQTENNLEPVSLATGDFVWLLKMRIPGGGGGGP
jgi:hypothetical protein